MEGQRLSELFRTRHYFGLCAELGHVRQDGDGSGGWGSFLAWKSIAALTRNRARERLRAM